MKRFLSKIFLFSTLPALFLLAGLYRLNGFSDPFYMRFTTPKQKSLILGTSRAAQGLQPRILNSILNRDDIYNYAFTFIHSPFGPVYFQSIRKKVVAHNKDGVFIVTIDPWSISSKSNDPNNVDQFQENNLALAKTPFVNMYPNIFYFFNCYDKPWIDLFKKQQNTGMFLHKDGWLELTISMDSNEVNKRLEQKNLEYRNDHLPVYKFSQKRWNYLIETIIFLQDHGRVYLVRLPIHPQIYAIETELMPEFSKRVYDLVDKFRLEYKDFTLHNSSYEYIDGNHLYKQSGELVSSEVAEWIKSLTKSRQ